MRCTYDTSSKNITFGMMPIRLPYHNNSHDYNDYEDVYGALNEKDYHHPNTKGSYHHDNVLRDPDMISITSAPEAPAPRIRILDSRAKEVKLPISSCSTLSKSLSAKFAEYSCLPQVETVRIGDRLTFRIEIPEKTPYGIFAR